MIAAENVKVQEEIIASPLGLYNILASICSIFDKGESQNLHNFCDERQMQKEIRIFAQIMQWKLKLF